MKFEIQKDFPPNYEQIKKVFDIDGKNIVFTYGISLYNPQGKEIEPHLIIHEQVHQRQQLEMGVEKWWKRYLEDKDFRQEQEVEAYAEQYKWVKTLLSNKETKEFLSAIANDLSTIYKLGINQGQAESAIRNYAKNNYKMD